MAKFLCITLNPAIDVTLELSTLNVGMVNRVTTAQSRAAGKGLNVAQILKGLGHDVWVTGFLGKANATIFEQAFKAQGFHNEFIYTEGETRQNIKVAEASGQMTDINSKGFSVGNEQKQQLLEKLSSLAKTVDYVVLSGSLPQQFSLDDFQLLITTIQKINPKLAIDSSGEALNIAVKSSPFLLKPNNDELCDSFGLSADTFTQQVTLLNHLKQTLNNQTPHWVISLGENGVNWLNAEQNLHANPPKVTVKSTVAAGDTLLAGILHGIANQLPKTESLKLATALASHTVSQIGCELPDDIRLAQLLQQTTVTPL